MPTPYLIETFRNPWKDAARREVAVQRTGAGFVAAVEAELVRRGVTDDLTLSIAKLIERRAVDGAVFADDELEDLRQWDMDHPAPSVPATEA